MTHPDSDRLVLLALDQQEPGEADAAHLNGCAACRDEYEALRTVAGLGREAEAEASLPPVSEAVWARIAADTGQSASEPPRLTAVGDDRATPNPPRKRRLAGAVRYGVVAAAAAGITAVATLTLPATGGEPDRVVAQVQLQRQAAAPAGASGEVQVLRTGSGALRLHLELAGMPDPAGLYQVWLYDGKTTMIPLGVTAGTEADVAIPPTVTLQAFPVVDVSAQQLGQQEHGTSMLQGTVRA
ncbi:anti-sigma factor [Amycolatopsis sp. Hca4]|uniref:anti-sigma factor domain-containing protein n=1 Tax=unclassified Amycolatopsis TaxID=2618356 RepID=UPI001591091E|nr:anti-sigma factor [Amycolatopsis sp. Hca4]QKV80309.1 anti-sigma factor [Amycolatopsis sp. Hca4]